MKLLNAAQVRAWDEFTIQQEPILSIDLMERAATACVHWLSHQLFTGSFQVFCGKGNNGGDGLAIARMLAGQGQTVSVNILEFGHLGTPDFQQNLSRLHACPQVPIRFVQSADHFPPLQPGDIVIDALYGSGLNRPLETVSAELVDHLNRSGATIISIDLPSGMLADGSSGGFPCIHATYTLCFQVLKPAFLLAENAKRSGKVQVLNIGLHPAYLEKVETNMELTDTRLINKIYRPRDSFGHKGTYGHALMVAGSFGKIGAALLSSRACLRIGAGLVTAHIPGCGYTVLQSMLPEAMVSVDFNSSFITAIDGDLEKYAAIGIGPGLGQARETRQLLRQLLENATRPLVIDADALNIIASDQELLKFIPKGSILTPHPKEFSRLFGETENESARNERAVQQAMELDLLIILKGHHTLIASPDGRYFYNNTGNAGMATAGSGDVLTGVLTGLLSQGYPPLEAAIFGVYLHGLAGDLAAAAGSMESLIAGDLIEQFGHAFQFINQK